jgi:uncharacterized protein YdiU (UPF0061 family)
LHQAQHDVSPVYATARISEQLRTDWHGGDNRAVNAPHPPALLADPAPPRWRGAQGLMQQLGAAFYTVLAPQGVPQPHWVATSAPLAGELGLADWLASDDALAVLSGNRLPAGSTPIASVYSGHQFGVWAGQLGDGRALLLGEADTPAGPMEIQLKGSGLTPYSRMADGRAVLRSSIREFLCSEAMAALGIPTTRALAVIGSPLPVRRETVETAAVVTRVAPSFLRFGHFEHFTHSAPDVVLLRRLIDAVIGRFYPEAALAEHPAAALLEAVARRTARLLAQWQAVGFMHGVMNTDNMSILGLTIDYGPFGFMDAYDPLHICNHSDHQGRYAYGRQPQVAYWNLHALAQALLPAIDAPREAAIEIVRAALEPYRDEFAQAMTDAMRAKLGLVAAEADDTMLIQQLVDLMAADRCDWTITWRALAQGEAARDHFIQRDAFDAWAARWRERLAREGSSDDAARAMRMNRVNPKFVLRNYLAQAAIERAQQGDFAEVRLLARVLERPYDEQPEHAAYAAFPPPGAEHIEVSCSS